jgi:hypothetical protein
LCFLAFCCISVELKPEEEAEREGAAWEDEERDEKEGEE